MYSLLRSSKASYVLSGLSQQDFIVPHFSSRNQNWGNVKRTQFYKEIENLENWGESPKFIQRELHFCVQKFTRGFVIIPYFISRIRRDLILPGFSPEITASRMLLPGREDQVCIEYSVMCYIKLNSDVRERRNVMSFGSTAGWIPRRTASRIR